MTTEADMLALIRRRHQQINMGTTPRYIIAEQPSYSDRHWTGARRADSIVLDRNWTTDYTLPTEARAPRHRAVIGYEVKVSRSDWLHELQDPDKAEAWRRFCHRWWLVASDKTIVKPGELPDGWGLLAPRGKTLTRITEAPLLNPLPLDQSAVLAITLSATRTPQPQPPKRGRE